MPERDRPFRVPWSIRMGSGSLPIPAVIGAVLTGGALVCVILLHGAAAYVGGAWMLVGLVGYFVYRRVFEGIPLTERVTIPEQALFKELPDVDLESILVPVFGEGLDDEIVGTAGRLAESDPGPGRERPRLELLYVIDLPLTVPLEAPPPPERLAAAEAALVRAKEVAAEYPAVDVAEGYIAARSIGEAIVSEAKRREVQAIVLGGEPPTRIKGGAVLGGVRASRPAEIGPVTQYVLTHAPCRVLLTAPPGA